MKKLIFAVVTVAAIFVHGAALTEQDWVSKKLVIQPTETKTEKIGCRDVTWYSHPSDPSWGATAKFSDRFAVAVPSGGKSEGAPLVVWLHSRGGGMPQGGIESMVKGVGGTGEGGVYRSPEGFCVLVLDSMRQFNVQANQTHEEFWWGGSGKFCGPKEGDVPRLLKGETSCEKRCLETIEWVIRRYKIDRNRVYLCGNSMGGQGTLAFGLPHGEIFAAINGNVPATIWFPAARMGFVDEKCQDNPAFDPTRFADPPVCVDWSGSDDVWSRNHDVIYRNMAKYKYNFIGLWGNYGHCGDVGAARKKNPLVERFDWLSIRKNAAYPVFTNASSDDKCPWPFSVWKPVENNWGGWAGDIRGDSQKAIAAGAKPIGQVNGFFRWENLKDQKNGISMNLFLVTAQELGIDELSDDPNTLSVPMKATADVSLRRIQAVKVKPGQSVKWEFGGKKGSVKADANGLITIPALTITAKKQKLVVRY